MNGSVTYRRAKYLVSDSVVVLIRAGKILYRYKECLDPGPESNNLLDRFLHFLHFETVLLIFLSSFINIP